MTRIDARKQTRDELHERRQQVIRLHEDGVPVMQIVERSGLSWSAVNSAIKRYQAQGESALMPSARGRKQGSGRTLTADQEARVRDFIRLRRPWFFRLKKSLWDREVVKQLIEQKYAVNLSTRVIGNYHDRWGLTLKRAKGRGYGNCTKAIRKWLDLNYTEILRQAREADAEIYWLTGMKVIDADLWCPEKTPQESVPGARPTRRTVKKKLFMASVVTNQGKVCWLINRGSFSTERQIKLMEALIKDRGRKKLFLIRTNWTHFGNRVFENWLGWSSYHIRIFPESRAALGEAVELPRTYRRSCVTK